MLNRFKSIHVSLQTSIAVLFSVIVIAFGLVIFFLSYLTFEDLILNVSNRSLANSTRIVNLKLNNLLSPYANFSRITDRLYETGFLDFEDKSEMRKYFLGIISANPAMYSIYLANPNGSFFQIKKNFSNPGFYIEEDFDRGSEPGVRMQRSLDLNGKVLTEKVIEDMSYDPRIRDWYRMARNDDDPIWSSIYQFAIKQERDLHGITHSRSISENSDLKYVFGIDVETNDLVDFIQKQKIYESSQVYLIDKDGEILSHSKVLGEEKSDPMQAFIDDQRILMTFLNYQKEGTPVQHSTFDGKDYVASYRSVDDLKGAEWTIGHIADFSEITAPIRKLIVIYWFVMIAATLISIFTAVYVSGKISKPINILALKAKKLARLELEHEKVPQSRIKEILRLSQSFESMNAALGSFIKYMPTNLVRRLLKQKLIAEPGGATRVLPIMFLDFKNFTSVSESMSPDFLMEYLSGYLECMTNLIHDYDGTVDKYIGDSIMAFWGAPGGSRDVHAYTIKACECTLAMQEELNRYNKNMKEKELPLLEMRIGLHVGEMTVGNLGSTDKLCYTVIGDSVNLASRLESLCKIYHVGSIVSEDVYLLVADHYQFQLLDCVQVKGKSTSIKVYEIRRASRFKEGDQILFERAFNDYLIGEWANALRGFLKLFETNPDDFLIKMYIDRIQNGNQKPPSDWNGSWIMETK